MSIGSKIKSYRKDSKLTQEALASKANISRSYLADIENDRYNASIETLKSIANSLDIKLSDLLEEPHSPEPSLTKKDERDIARAIDNTLGMLETQQEGLMFNGEALDDETRELLRASLENSMKMAKKIAKEKYTPKKYKK